MDSRESARQRVKTRLREYLDSDECRAEFEGLRDDSERSKRQFIDNVVRSERFRRWKANTLEELRSIPSASDCESDDATIRGDSPTSSQTDFDDDHFVSSGMTGTRSTLAFLGRNYLKRVIDVLMAPSDRSTRDDVDAKCSTLQALSQLPSSEICESEHWLEFKGTLRKLFCCTRDQPGRRICDSALALLSKLFNSSSHNVQLDSFSLLADHLKEDVFTSTILLRVKEGRRLEFGETRDAYVVQKFRVFNEMCIRFVKTLPRYNQQLLAQVADKIIDLIEFQAALFQGDKGSRRLTPFLAWSILDPRMKWWRYWMHARLGRIAVLSALGRHPRLIEFLISVSISSSIGKHKLDVVQYFAASSMMLRLLLHEESRRHLLGQGFSLDDILDQLITHAFGGDQREKFAWRILTALASNEKGQGFLLNERRLRRIGLELSNKERSYDTKIKVLALVKDLVTVCRDGTPILMDYSFDYFGEKLSFYQLITKVISSSIVAASSRDPDAPLSLVYACFNVCTAMCSASSGRRLVSQCDEFLIYAMKLVKERSIEVELLLPILSSVVVQNRDHDAILKKFLSSGLVCKSKMGSAKCLLWHRPIEASDSLVQEFAVDLNELITSTTHQGDVDSGRKRIDVLIRQLFLILCHPDGGKLLLNNADFIRLISEPFQSDEFQETPFFCVLLNLLDLALCRPDFAIGVRRRCDVAKIVADLLLRHYSFDLISDTDQDDGSSKFSYQSMASCKLADAYSKLQSIGGPSERPVKLPSDWNPTSLDELINEPKVEPCPGLVIVSDPNRLEGRLEGDTLIEYFLRCLERKRVQHLELLLEASKDWRLYPDESVDGSAPVDVKIYEIVLEYGRHLNILGMEKPGAFDSFVQRVATLTKTVGDCDIDWFAAVVFLIFGGNGDGAIDFLRKFLRSGAPIAPCIWSRLSSSFTTAVITEVVWLVDQILEKELPRVVAALTSQGVTPSNFSLFWVNQCFVNVLEWPEICNYITLSVIGGVRYQAFFCCCVCHQFCDVICRKAYVDQNCDLHSFFLGPIPFKLSDSAPFLSYLSGNY